MLLNFSDRTRTGAFNMTWPLAREHFVPLKCVVSVKHCFVGPRKSLEEVFLNLNTFGWDKNVPTRLHPHFLKDGVESERA